MNDGVYVVRVVMDFEKNIWKNEGSKKIGKKQKDRVQKLCNDIKNDNICLE